MHAQSQSISERQPRNYCKALSLAYLEIHVSQLLAETIVLYFSYNSLFHNPQKHLRTQCRHCAISCIFKKDSVYYYTVLTSKFMSSFTTPSNFSISTMVILNSFSV